MSDKKYEKYFDSTESIVPENRACSIYTLIGIRIGRRYPYLGELPLAQCEIVQSP